jgi:hypothetical protein
MEHGIGATALTWITRRTLPAAPRQREADELKRSPEADSRTLRHAQAPTSLPSTSTAPPGALNCLDIGSK